ncbi:MAG TPA: hypothetical protein VEW48_06245 [Thermoanaerobaculia bacterium]|nr:hypothetical protein [Thermoanaerobaculia bacterium]
MSGESVVERRLPPYSYARHDVAPGEPPAVELEVIDEKGAVGSTLRVQPLDSRDDVVLMEGKGGDCEVRVLAPEEPAGTVSHGAQMERMIEAMLPPLSTLLPSTVEALQARRNAEARASLVRDFGALTSTQVAELAGSRASNRAALANRWKQEGRIFSVNYEGATLYPAFQLDAEGRPWPVIAEVIRTLGSKSTDWELALWFTTNVGWLDGQRPVDLLESDPAAVAEAAESEAAELVY